MNAKKRIITTSLMLLFMVVALGTGVFAWFTINTRATATGLEGTAEAADGGFYIRIKDENIANKDNYWQTELDLSNLKPLGSKEVLVPLTSEEGTKFNKLGSTTLETEGFFEFTLEFLTGTTFSNVWLEELEIKQSVEKSWVSEFDFTSIKGITRGDTLKAKLSDAIRVSFENEDPADNEVKAIIEQDGADIAKYVDEITRDAATKTVTFGNTTGFGGFALDYLNKIADNAYTSTDFPSSRDDIEVSELQDTNGILLSSEKKDVGVDNFIKVGTNDPVQLDGSFKLLSTVTVRIWLEGWDGEAFNAVAGGILNIDFVFRAKEY